MSGRRALGVVLLAVFLTVGVASVALGARKHRLKPLPKPAFPRTLSVDETEFALGPSRTVVSSGKVKINVYNRGMDDHDLVVYDPNRVALGATVLGPGASGQVTVALPAGNYQVVCSLFAGTPVSHETLGMAFTLRVEDPPTVQPRVRQRSR